MKNKKKKYFNKYLYFFYFNKINKEKKRKRKKKIRFNDKKNYEVWKQKKF